MSEAYIIDTNVIRRFLKRWGKTHISSELRPYYFRLIDELGHAYLCDELCEVINENRTVLGGVLKAHILAWQPLPDEAVEKAKVKRIDWKKGF